jgi:RND family efflux transporter MFP subunit
MKKAERKRVLIGGAVFLTLWMVGCDKPSVSPEILAPPLAVEVGSSGIGGDGVEEVPGTVRPILYSQIASKLTGVLLEVKADVGMQVKAGQVVARIDEREIQARLSAAQAVLTQVEGEKIRYTKLLSDRVITQQEFDGVRSRYEQARAAYTEAASQLDDATIRAPFDGVVTRKWVERGDMAAPGKMLFDMESPAAWRLEAQFPESLAGSVQLNDRMPVSIDAAQLELEGVVSEIAPSSDSATHTFTVKLNLPSSSGIRSGQFGRVRVKSGGAASLAIPSTAILKRGQMEMVFVAEGGQARMRLVRTGKVQGTSTEILSGLDAGEKILLAPPADLVDGQAIQPILKP